MSTTSTGSLSAGVQQLYNSGLLPSNLGASTLNGASANQINQLASTTIAGQQAETLLGIATDSATLSSTATNALLQEINPSSNSTSTSSADPLTAAVNNALTSSINAAVNKFAPSGSTTAATGNNINVVG